MTATLICWLMIFSWLSFVNLGVRVIIYLKERGHWMLPIYVIWGVILFIGSFILKNFLMVYF